MAIQLFKALMVNPGDMRVFPYIGYRGILVYNTCFISISNSVSDGATKSVLNIERA